MLKIVICGGNCYSDPIDCGNKYRFRTYPIYFKNNVGFRLIKKLK